MLKRGPSLTDNFQIILNMNPSIVFFTIDVTVESNRLSVNIISTPIKNRPRTMLKQPDRVEVHRLKYLFSRRFFITVSKQSHVISQFSLCNKLLVINFGLMMVNFFFLNQILNKRLTPFDGIFEDDQFSFFFLRSIEMCTGLLNHI